MRYDPRRQGHRMCDTSCERNAAATAAMVAPGHASRLASARGRQPIEAALKLDQFKLRPRENARHPHARLPFGSISSTCSGVLPD